MNDKTKSKKKNKYEYKINKNLSLGYMKDRIIEIFLSDDPKYYNKLKDLFKINPVPIRKGRKNPRILQDKNRRTYFINRKRSA